MDDRLHRREREPEPTLGEAIDGAARRISTGLMIGGAAVALALYARPGPPRYQAIPTDTGIVRVDTREGTVLHCVANGCYTVVRSGQTLLDQDERQKARAKAFGDEPPDQRALPAPQPSAQPSQAEPPQATPGNAQ